MRTVALTGTCLAPRSTRLQHVVDRALLDQQALLHEQLAKVEVGVAQQRKDGASVGKAQARLRLAAVAEDQRLS